MSPINMGQIKPKKRSLIHILPALGVIPANLNTQGAAGIGSGTLSLATQQVMTGNAVKIVSWSSAKASDFSTQNGINIQYIQPYNWAKFMRWDFRWAFPVLWKLKTSFPDILHVHSDPNLLLAAHPRARIFHFRTPVPENISGPYQKIFSKADAVICNSNFIAAQARKALALVSPERIHVVHNGADSGFFEPRDRDLMRKKWGLNEDDFVILFAGALVPEKGVDHAIQGFKEACPLIHNPHLVIIGSSGLWPTIDSPYDQISVYSQKISKLAQQLPVHFVGAYSRSEMPFALAAADVVVIPSVWEEPFGTIVVEAMAAGTPVIAYRSGGIPESVEENVTGILVKKGNVAGLTDAILTLYQNPDLRRNMSAAAKERARERFTWEIAAQKIDQIYESVLSKWL